MTARSLTLLALTAALIAGVLGVQVANGGGAYTPTRATAPCTPRTITSVSSGIDGLGERLVLLALDGAACRLHVTREALLLQLAQQRRPTDAQVTAVRAALLAAVDRLNAAGSLPRASQLTDEAVQASDLNGLLKAAIRALPDSLIDNALKTDDVLRRAIRKIDIRKLLTNLRDPDELTRQINSALTQAVKDALVARLRGLI